MSLVYPESEFELSVMQKDILYMLDDRYNLVKVLTLIMLETEWDPARVLREHQIDVNYEFEGQTPLMDAHESGYLKMSKILLDAGAYIHQTVRHRHDYYDVIDVMGWLLERDDCRTAFKCAAMTQLCDYGFNAQLVEYPYHLHQAVHEPIELCKLLFQHGNISHELWSVDECPDEPRRPIDEAMSWKRNEHVLYLRQEEFMYHLVRLCMQRTNRLSAVRQIPPELWRMIGGMVI